MRGAGCGGGCGGGWFDVSAVALSSVAPLKLNPITGFVFICGTVNCEMSVSLSVEIVPGVI